MYGLFYVLGFLSLITLIPLGIIFIVFAVLKKKKLGIGIAWLACLTGVLVFFIFGTVTNPTIKCDHEFELVEEVKPTNDEAGHILYHCDKCGLTKMVPIPKIEESAPPTFSSESTQEILNDSPTMLSTQAPTESPTIIPTQKSTDPPPTEKQSTVIYDSDGIKITYKGISTGIMGTEVNLLIENNSSTDCCVQTRDMSVNGYMIDPAFSPEVGAGKKANADILFLKSQLKDNDITSIHTLEFKFCIFDWDNMLDSIIETETIVLEIP